MKKNFRTPEVEIIRLSMMEGIFCSADGAENPTNNENNGTETPDW